MLIDTISSYTTKIFHKGFVPIGDVSESARREKGGIKRGIQLRG